MWPEFVLTLAGVPRPSTEHEERVRVLALISPLSIRNKS